MHSIWCFEIIDDLKTLSTDEVEALINRRWNGLKILRDRIGDDDLMYNTQGGYEIFTQDQHYEYQECIDRIEEINELVFNAIAQRNCFELVANPFGIKNYQSLVYNQYEGQLHPGMMMKQLQKIVIEKGIEVQYGVNVESYEAHSQGVSLITKSKNYTFRSDKLLITTNAFTATLVDDIDLKPGRNQVMMTKPIKGLKIKGCFHYDKGYVYFRDFNSRLLIGGGRNTAMHEESTENFGVTDQIKEYLRKLVKDIILPNTEIEEEMWWSGIIATGSNKKPIVQEVTKNVYLGVRLGGMGVALGSLIGKELAELV